MINWAKTHDIPKLSLAFAPFPELFADIDRTRFHHLVYTLIHFGDPLIASTPRYRPHSLRRLDKTIEIPSVRGWPGRRLRPDVQRC